MRKLMVFSGGLAILISFIGVLTHFWLVGFSSRFGLDTPIVRWMLGNVSNLIPLWPSVITGLLGIGLVICAVFLSLAKGGYRRRVRLSTDSANPTWMKTSGVKSNRSRIKHNHGW
jgi:hypothetical protein